MRILVLAVSLLLGFNGVSRAGMEAPDIARIQKRGTLVVAMYFEDVSPFFMAGANGELEGIDVEIAQAIGKKLGVKVEFRRGAKTFDELVRMVARREADVAISMLSRTVDRAVYVRFTDPYVVLSQALIINRLQAEEHKDRKKGVVEMLDQGDNRIGVVMGSSYEGFARQLFPRATVVPYDTWDQVVADVLKGSILAGMYDEVEVRRLLREKSAHSLYIKSAILSGIKDDIAIAVNREDLHLHYWLDEFIRWARDSRTLERIFQKYQLEVR